MTIPFTTESIFFMITIVGVLFSIYRSYRDPQSKSEIGDAVMSERISVLGATVQKIVSNDLPHIDARVQVINDNQVKLMVDVSSKFAKIEAILNERLPTRP
jgi:uncharacterized membrane protein